MVPIEKVSSVTVGDAIATMSHRIKNILQGINGGAHVVEMGLGKNDVAAVTKGWEIVKRNQNQISQLVMNLMILSKPYEANRETCDLREVLARSVKSQSSAFKLEHIDFSVSLGRVECTVNVDSQATQLMFENLLSVVFRTVQSFEARFCKIRFSLTRDLVEVIFEFGGTEPRTEPVEAQRLPTSKIDQQFCGIEVDVANRIAAGNAAKIVFSEDSPLLERISVSTPRI